MAGEEEAQAQEYAGSDRQLPTKWAAMPTKWAAMRAKGTALFR